MSLSEIKDSGKLSGQNKSNFSHTCTLLSQYLKEKGSFGDLTLGLSTNFQPHGLSAKMEKPGQNTGAPIRENSQMTIFYGGQVMVFDDFPADKVKEIMGMASKTGSQAPNIYTPTTRVQKPLEPAASKVVPGLHTSLNPENSHLPPQRLVNDLPIARKASLARFFEKRKDRITARAPYQTGNFGAAAASSRSSTESKTWLGLGAESPLQMEGHL